MRTLPSNYACTNRIAYTTYIPHRITQYSTAPAPAHRQAGTQQVEEEKRQAQPPPTQDAGLSYSYVRQFSIYLIWLDDQPVLHVTIIVLGLALGSFNTIDIIFFILTSQRITYIAYMHILPSRQVLTQVYVGTKYCIVHTYILHSIACSK